ncbi:MAG: type II toxin-antitoxin system mRNA interferase toxin, RelE/StbE family [Candidatus Eremiobacteraeota bacterium]|nr:type II toxin-antitoxin system mRNA interferase toxin, RelE/StbE family [Candidatus Eremiobacteraeota bacterium]
MRALFSADFKKAVQKFASIKRAIQKKVDMILEEPLALGEPLRGSLKGYYSCPVKKNFLIIYLYCHACRRRKDDRVVACADCGESPDETVKFVNLGPHDETYRTAP